MNEGRPRRIVDIELCSYKHILVEKEQRENNTLTMSEVLKITEVQIAFHDKCCETRKQHMLCICQCIKHLNII